MGTYNSSARGRNRSWDKNAHSYGFPNVCGQEQTLELCWTAVCAFADCGYPDGNRRSAAWYYSTILRGNSNRITRLRSDSIQRPIGRKISTGIVSYRRFCDLGTGSDGGDASTLL